MTSLRFALPRAEVLTANQRLHWAQKARLTKDLRFLGKIVTAPHLDRLDPDDQAAAFHDRAHLTVHVGWPDKRRRDVANISPTIKALLDGIVDAGLLPDDDDTHLIGPDLRPYVAAMRGHVILDFEFEEVT
jgi:crossover junction endodeoxyribonuclease RusA